MKIAFQSLITIIFFIVFQTGHSQELQVKAKQGVGFLAKGEMSHSIGLLDEYLFAISWKNDDSWLVAVNAETKTLIFQKKLDATKIGKSQADNFRIIIFGGHLVFFYSVEDKDTGRYLVYARKMNKSGDWAGELEVVENFTSEFEGTKRTFDWRNIGIHETKSGKQIILAKMWKSDLKKQKVVTCKVLGHDLKVEGSHEFSFYDTTGNAWQTNFNFENDADFYIGMISSQAGLVEVTNYGKTSRMHLGRGFNEKVRLSIIHYNMNSQKVTVYDVEPEVGRNVMNHKIMSDVNEDILITGLYEDASNPEFMKGVYTSKIDHESGKTIYRHIHAFNESVVRLNDQLLGAKGVELSPGIAALQIGDSFLAKNGNQVLICEVVIQTSSMVKGSPTYEMTYAYYNGLILVMEMDSNGNLLFMVPILKSQRTHNDDGRYSSYACLQGGNSLYLLFNDHRANGPESVGHPEKIQTMTQPLLLTLKMAQIQDGTVKFIENESLTELSSVSLPTTQFPIEKNTQGKLFLFGEKLLKTGLMEIDIQ